MTSRTDVTPKTEKLLCLLGRHRWEYDYDYRSAPSRRSRCCGRYQVRLFNAFHGTHRWEG